MMIYITTEIDFKHILFISTWMLDNLLEKYMKWALDPHPPFATDFLWHPTCNLLDGP